MKKIFVLVLACTFVSIFCSAQDIKLTVSGQGNTEQLAIDNALRNAIEQTFGSFVSANTTILDDELVKDEIVSVSKGNIKSYKKIGSVEKNGMYDVSIEAIVSVGNLVEYAKSRGSACELSGNAFTAELRRVKLNQQNTVVALEHLVTQLTAIADRGLFDYTLEANPYADGSVDIKVNVIPNDNYKHFNELISSTLSSLALSDEQVHNLEQKGIKYSTIKYPCKEKVQRTQRNRYNFQMETVVVQIDTTKVYKLYDYDLQIGDSINEILASAFMNCYIKDNLGNTFFVTDGNRRNIVPLMTYGEEGGIRFADRESSEVHKDSYLRTLRHYSSYKLEWRADYYDDVWGFVNDPNRLQIEPTKILSWNDAEYREIPAGNFTSKIIYSMEELEKVTGLTIENVKEDELYYVLSKKVKNTSFSLLTDEGVKEVVENLAILRFYRYYNLTDSLLSQFTAEEAEYERSGGERDCYCPTCRDGLLVRKFFKDEKNHSILAPFRELVNSFYYIDQVALLHDFIKCPKKELVISDTEHKQRAHERVLEEITRNWTDETLEERQMFR